jgi:hypothetical protein
MSDQKTVIRVSSVRYGVTTMYGIGVSCPCINWRACKFSLASSSFRRSSTGASVKKKKLSLTYTPTPLLQIGLPLQLPPNTCSKPWRLPRHSLRRRDIVTSNLTVRRQPVSPRHFDRENQDQHRRAFFFSKHQHHGRGYCLLRCARRQTRCYRARN